MNLSHLKLPGHPPDSANAAVTDFFYGGANRGATLDALVYVLTHGEGAEGIITMTGESGSGKSTLCRLLMKRLPAEVQTVYIAQPVADPEEFLDSIVRELGFRLTGPAEDGTSGNSISTIEQLEKLLEQKYAAGERVVLLIDEAQAMTREALNELRSVYELELPRHKLLQIVLAGQNELERTLDQPSVRKLRDLISHRFRLKPLGFLMLTEYLSARIRASNCPGPGMFTPHATKLIGMASAGLISSINTLADSSVGIAASENAQSITEEHVRKAIDASGIKYPFNWRSWSDGYGPMNYRTNASIAVSIAALALLGWFGLRTPSAEFSPVVGSPTPNAASPVSTAVPAKGTVPPAPISVYPSHPSTSMTASNAPSPAFAASSERRAPPEPAAQPRPSQDHLEPAAGQGTGKLNIGGVKLAGFKLLEQRVEATTRMMESVDPNQYTIQLFSTENIQPDRMERFLIRAGTLVELSDLHVHVVNTGDKAKFRVTYGIYSSRDHAAAAVTELPEKYQSAFHPELFNVSDFR